MSLEHVVGQRGDGVLVAHVGAHALNRTERRQLPHRLLQHRFFDICDHYSGTPAKQRLGDALSDAARPPGDDCRRAGDVEVFIVGAHLVLERRAVGHRSESSPRFLGQTSSISVTGPSLVSSTAMLAPKEPVATVAPKRRSSVTSSSISRAASSGAAAATNDGRRPLRVSP